MKEASEVIARVRKRGLVRHPVAEGSALTEVLLRWRMHNQMNIAGAALGLGVSRATWGHWESGLRYPSPSNLHLLSLYTGLPPVAFLCPQWPNCPFSRSQAANGASRSRPKIR